MNVVAINKNDFSSCSLINSLNKYGLTGTVDQNRFAENVTNSLKN